MAEIMSSQKMKRTCDACGAEKEWELIGVSEDAIREMQEWYMLTRAVMIDGRFGKLTSNACSLPCVPGAAMKIAMPPIQDEPADDIDLASLRASAFRPEN